MSKLTKYKFSDLYEMSSGISSSKEQAGHGSPFISFSTVFNNYFLPEELPDLMDTSLKEQEIFSVKKDDVFITRTSETVDALAMSCVAVKDYPKATFSGFVKRLRPKTTGIVYSKYIAFFLRSKYFRKVLDCNTIMTLRASFNEDMFSFLYLYLPDYEEQVRIGDLLYKMEMKIRTNNKINDNLEQQAKLLYDYWFTQFDFPDENGKPYRSSGGKMVWNEQLKMEIPFSWICSKMENAIEAVRTGLNPRNNFQLGNGNIQYITVKNLCLNGSLDFSGCDTIDEQARQIVHRRSDIQRDDILFASIAPLGRCYLIQENPTNWDINESVFSIRYNSSVLTAEYLYMNLQSETFVKRATACSTGSIFKGIRINSLMDSEIILPPLSVTKEFSKEIKPLFALQKELDRETHTLIQLRDWLLPMLMNGQATISD
ncbi:MULTISPECIES: restriction endonuclease subunit S [Lachnospiraceae]|uniref:Restriction endonuclease subunit S n=2 Tax=Lachnospiraceae TaxID=186803 RepID=A0A412F0P4_9FIRM|nr:MULTISPECIES: restriction endonuclease subunit S [Lachnospiraceae]MDM0581299.1 restriction endonuclease subunit S [Clostridium perfringens]MCB5620681.1 restriction endonuclease subunit S [Mediterraneibacter gnavus]MCB5665929.1 restriction endonuclease subunit S [Mediterraneibacter gnavus]MCB5682975.1 restriction endonuclease subunit S [Mediterraneibacter gnavus]NSH26098.1 restriction endonuclease subunit S [Anaerostipes hadrus]